MKKYFFTIVAVAFTSMLTMTSCNKDAHEDFSNISPVSYTVVTSGDYSSSMIDAFVEYVNGKLGNDGKLTRSRASISSLDFTVNNMIKCNEILNNIATNHTELDKIMDKLTADREVVRIEISHDGMKEFVYSYTKHSSDINPVGTYKYTDTEGREWQITLRNENGSEWDTKYGTVTVPGGYTVESKTYPGCWEYIYDDVYLETCMFNEKGSPVVTLKIAFSEAKGNEVPVTILFGGREIIEVAPFEKM